MIFHSPHPDIDIPDGPYDALILAQAPAGTQVIEIAEAAHHVPIDQPLALAEAIGAIADEIVRSEGLAQGETRS